MDIVSLGVLFLLILGGGVSAFLADWLGWRIGKKRLSVRKMRPKHFARLVVTIAGACIPLVTIGLLAGSSEGVRVWITRGREAAQQLPSVERQLNDARQQLDWTREEARRLGRKNQDVQGRLDARTTKLGETETALKERSERLAKQTELISRQSARIEALGPRLLTLTRIVRLRESDVARLTEANRSVKASLTRTGAVLAEERRSLALLRKEAAFLKRETNTIQLELNENNVRNRQLTDENVVLERSIAQLRIETDRLSQEITRLTAARDEARTESEAARADLAALRVEVAGLQTVRDQLQQAVTQFRGDFAQVRTQPLTFRVGDELARIVVSARASVADVRATIESLLRQARLEAERRGARPNTASNPPMRAADLAELRDRASDRMISANEQIERLAGQLAGAEGDTVIVARSLWNIFEGEAVALDLPAFPDPLVFRAGEVIAEGRLDSRRGDAAVYAQINEFLGTRVQDRAREAKMVPLRAGGEETFGQIEPEQILEVIRTARTEERVYRLQAIAVGDIRAGDRLKIELRLK